MELSGIRPGRRTRHRLDELICLARRHEPTYDHQRSTLAGAAPAGVPERIATLDVDGHLATAAATLDRWAAHDGLRATVYPPHTAPDGGGETIVLAIPFGPVELAVANRIIATIDDPDRYGFAYGTLPGHPETGEELFLAEQSEPNRLRLTVRIHARPATAIARLATPVVGPLQASAARRYLDAWAAAITEETP